MKRASYSCGVFLCVVLAVTCLKYCRYHLLCLPFVWHFLFNVTHTHTLLFFLFCKVGSDRLMKRGSCSCSIFLCNVLAAAWSIAGIACRACRSSGTFFSFWRTQTRVRAHTHTHTHTRTHTHTYTRMHAHTHMCMLDGLFLSFYFFFSIHVGHDHGLVRCIVFAHILWTYQFDRRSTIYETFLWIIIHLYIF